MNLCYLLIALPLFLCAENYIVENEKHQTLFFISTATQTDKTADFLSMTFPESNRRMQSFPRFPKYLKSRFSDIHIEKNEFFIFLFLFGSKYKG